ncbi:ricin-type beta-trefoil lectin domain protein [Streptomyces sp. NBC_01764]|uniref:RICIN domain-containing protein n=1 Tax=Streptomyces sp. NBC_01764 TaxID=2975935 RepID=UPI0022522651|nr:RICIN domain-containing protein [Streptomyces sp. NBC_01764]MCX4411160.1 ricin-type beta-trefoil lectin domain protein [Streptomyces sp. NBC_01764]
MAGLATPVVPLASLALLATIAVHPEPTADRGPRTSPVADSYDGFDTKAAEQLRLDQCLMADGLRRGGPNLYGLANTSLPLPADQLHQKADRTWGTGAFAQAWQKDSDDSDAWVKKAQDTDLSFKNTISGLDDYPGSPEAEKIFDKTGMLPWLYQSYFKSVDLLSPFYDPSPQADGKTKKAALAIGDPLYSSGGTSEEQAAWKLWKKNSGDVVPNELFVPRVLDDDARIFLASGGFPRTAPTPDSPEFRIAVEDLKSRFASCAWHGPIDPDRVLGKEVAQASGEWQQEITSQATQRNQILAAGSTATKALQDGTFALGKMLGQSWIADYSTRWLDYYTEGGLGWIGNGQLEIQVPGAAGKCLDVAGGAKTNGTPVQVYTCNGGAAQQWQLLGSYDGGYTLVNPNSFKCLEVLNGNSADGTKIQIRDCGSAEAQQWKFDVRSAGPLRNAATGKCLHLPTFDNSKDAVLSTCNGSAAQKFRIVPKTHTGTAPAKADVDKAKANITAAQAEAKKQLALLKTQLETAQKAATTSDTALQAAYGIADTNGAPRGRGLLVGLQKDQVTKGAAAALTALEKAGETAEAATRASAGDSATIAQRALAQAAQSKAEFRKKAAETAELQAKAAADAAKVHRDNAKKDKETAEARLTDALKAEGDARAAAADAHAKRLAAEAEEKTAKAEKENAAVKRSEAAEHRKNAESQAAKAKDAKDKAEASEKTAGDRRDDAVKAKDHAKSLRDDAWDAEQKADAARAKADAKNAYADKLDAGDAADAARAAADAADGHADDAEAAAGRARSEADAATQAAADADAAATRAEAAAKRARSDADAAQADKLKADAAVKTATSAVADAIKASQDASAEAKAAVKLADEAEQHAKDAKTQANAANAEAGKALAASAKAAGYAHVTAQAAVDAGKSAEQVADPANDAIQLGSPYADNDSTAGLVVLTGQASKTIADQQQAVADAHAKNAAAEAQAAKNLADQAKGDAKEAYQHAANAAQYAADARTYSKDALGYAADAAKAASAAASSLARTVDYDNQATADAAAADKAAGNAEGYAKEARDSADAAELDASAARSAAAQAEQDAKDARAAATRADTAATEAEQAAKDADKYAKEAQEAADRAEKAEKAKQINDGTVPDENGHSIGNVFHVIDHIEKIGDPEVIKKTDGCDHWWNHLAYTGNCTITSKIKYKAVVDLYLCSAEGIDPQKLMCPTEATTYLGEVKTDELSQEVTHNITIAEWQDGVDPIDILFGSWIKCAQKFTSGFEGGSWGGCAWASLDVASLFAGKIIRPIAEALRAVDAAFVTGIGVRDAFNALKAIDGIDTAAVAAIEREVDLYEEIVTSCSRNSFPGGTQVLMADGTRRPIKDVRVGDLVLATDPASGKARPEPVTDTFRHDTNHLVDITLASDGTLTSTTGHRVYSADRGWVRVSDLRVGERLRAADGSLRTVTALNDRVGMASQRVYDLTVEDLHTFYVRSEGRHAADLLVHNCVNLSDEIDFPESGAHTLSKHVNRSPAGAVEDAQENLRKGLAPISTLWTNADIAQQAVDRVLAQYFFPNGKKNAARQATLDNFLAKRKQWADKTELVITGKWDKYESLGTVYKASGPPQAAGNEVRVVLKRLPGKKGHEGFIVFDSYPLAK